MEDARPSKLARFRDWWNRVTDDDGSWQTTALLAVLGVIVFLVVEPCLMRAGRLKDPASFESPVLLVSCLSSPSALVPAVLGAALVALGWNKLSYKNWGEGSALRVIFGVLALLVAWSLSAAEYDYYWDQARVADRIILAGLALLVWVNPAWLALFTPAAVVLLAPYAYVLEFTWAGKVPVFAAMSVGVAFCWLKLVAPRLTFAPCLCAMMWLAALMYLKPGLGKLSYGWEWVALNDLSNLHQSAAFQNGWTTDLAPWLQETLAVAMQYLNIPFKVGTILLEVGVLCIVARRSLAVLFLVGCASMHLGIFVYSGIFFWMWIALDLLLACVLATLPAERVKEIFRPQLAACGLVAVVALLGLYKRAPMLAWLDSPLARRWMIEAVGESGQRYQITPAVLAPYDSTVAQARLDFMCDHKSFVGCFGSVKDAATRRELEAAASVADIEAIRKTAVARAPEPETKRRFVQLLERLIARGPSIAEHGVYAYIKPPHHTCTRPVPGTPLFEFQEPITRIEIFAQESLRGPEGMTMVHDSLAYRLPLRETPVMAEATGGGVKR